MNILERNEITLDALTEEDKHQILAWRNSIELKRLTGWSPFIPLCKDDISIANSSTMIQFAIRAAASQEMIGYICLSNIDWSNANADLGIFIGDIENRGRHYGSTAIICLLEYAFRELNLHRVQADVVEYNTQAIDVYRDLGFKHEGTRRQFGKRNGKRYDVLNFGILAGEWNPERVLVEKDS